MKWADLSIDARLEAIRRGYLEGLTNAQIGARLETTKSAVLGLAWRWRLTRQNAPVWSRTTKRERYPENRTNRVRVPKPRKPVSERRAKLRNLATDPESRRIVDAINALPLYDHDTLHAAMRLGRRGALVGRVVGFGWRQQPTYATTRNGALIRSAVSIRPTRRTAYTNQGRGPSNYEALYVYRKRRLDTRSCVENCRRYARQYPPPEMLRLRRGLRRRRG
jgi:hypothetical protein